MTAGKERPGKLPDRFDDHEEFVRLNHGLSRLACQLLNSYIQDGSELRSLSTVDS
jgi:hypothetical protein